ncbi:MAG TPA: chromosome segregation protein SMC [Oligoflexia bacterium]|nr:chromosome segregation protein SMC [Oligoflexia bacterium]
MRVKRLEIQGFKSFKDKTVIHFDDGVTGIVGPNGCGKSNIVDSFFWVMGEQSTKHLRGSGQGDLIFNGSEKYSPSGMAEVTMVLSTGAKGAEIPEGMTIRDLPAHLRFEEIAITRRLFRDGESEYLINGQTCRLKDIHELFMDTGAGPKAYSIIEQGQISRIVQQKPEERRTLIEEAAGIVKFKARKKESLRKIEATQQNLLRINDIVAEIERQLGSLERQATKARQYKKYKEELQGKELLSGRKKLFGLKKRSLEVAGRVQELEITDVERRNSLQVTELQIENLKLQMTEAQRLAEETQQQLQILQREISQDDTRIQLHRRNIQELENSNLTLDEEREELISDIERLSAEHSALENEALELEALFKNADEMLREQQAQLDSAKLAADELGRLVEQEKRDLMASLNRRNEISNQVHGLEAKVDSLSVQVNSLNLRIADREVDTELLTEKASAARELYQTSATQADALRVEVEGLASSIVDLDTRLGALRKEDSVAREEKAKTESKHKTIQELVDNHEGFRADVQAILKDESFAGSITGVFADRLEAHPGYEYALEGVLREFLESLFVENATKAREMIAVLKEQSVGRATFWPADLVAKRSISSPNSDLVSTLRSRGIEATALAEVIRLDAPNSAELLKLFDRYWVVASLDDAVTAFEAAADLGLCFVSREGDVVDSFGRVAGGSVKSLETGILARKAELQRLTELLTEWTGKCQLLSESLAAVESDLIEKKSIHATKSAQLREVDLAAKSAERDLASLESQLSSIQSELERQKNEREQLEAGRRDLWQKLDSIRQELSSMEDSTRARESVIEEKSRAHNQSVIKVSEIQGAMIQMKVDFAAANEKHRNSKQNRERVVSQLSKDKSRLEEVERMINRKLDEKDLVASELGSLETRMQELTVKAQELEQLLASRKNELEKTNHMMSDSFEKQREALRNVEEASSELSRLKLEQERSQLEYQMVYQNLFEKYGVEESAIAPQNDEDQRAFDELTPERETEMSEEVERLRERIRKLGEVNVMAVEEYDEQKKRHDFLMTQREDLLKSIHDLEKAIERINKTSEERFRIAFEEINSRFQRIFPIVFGGGGARLEMTNPADLNETGVEILAEPPGKKIGSIQLMSGGEKALTAVALIFSIFLIKPSPFCVLDEVDAPLDDHNVGKFNMLLKEMAIRSQFIIITHNKRTMELNDKLYGVTMEEPGVSKMVSIQLQ